MELLDSGPAEVKFTDPDDLRDWFRDHKKRGLVNKVMSEREAINTFVNDGDYIAYDATMMNRGPSSLIREIARQRKKNLWVCGKTTYVIAGLLAAGGCVSGIDVGFIGTGASMMKGLREGTIKAQEWSNDTLSWRLLAGALGIPFLPSRIFGGTDSYRNAGAKTVTDPFTGKPIVLLPSLNPDVGLVHVHQCDVYGNARIFGVSFSPKEVACASKKLILSTEEIVDSDEIRRSPSKTTIPYYFVDAVVHAPFGSYPGHVPGLYAPDREHIIELTGSLQSVEREQAYLEKYVYGVDSHEDLLERRVGAKRMVDLMTGEGIKEGYYR